jgi:methylmalonyl-CoA/ethylmalonyl-CoA epimerase
MELLQVALHVDDLARARTFYELLLGYPAAATFDPPGLVFFHVGGVRLLLDTGAPASLVYLKVDDLAGTLDRLQAAGVEVVSEAHVIFQHDDDALGPVGTDESMAFVRDSEGNLVGLVSQVPR